ncbi:MAG: flippase [Candidatus Andersenbacteria bacterium]
MAQSIFSNTLISGAGRIGTIVLGIATTALVTRYLGAAGYGSYALLLSVGTMVQIAADFGLYLTLTRDIAEQEKKEQELFGIISSLRAALLVAWIGTAAVVITLLPQYRALLPVFVIIALGLVAQSFSQLLMGVYQKYKEVWKATFGDVIGRLLQFGIVFLIVRQVPISSVSATTAVLYMAGAFLAGAVVAYGVHVLLVPAIQPWRFQVSPARWWVLLKSSWPLGLLLVLNVIYFRTDIVIISLFRSSDEVGLYGLAYRIIESGLFFPAMFGGLLLPQLAVLYSRQAYSVVQRLLEQALRFMVIVGVLAAGSLAIFASDILIFLSGVEFAAAAPIVQILAGALAFMFVGNIFGFALVSLHKQKQLLLLYAALVAGNVAANLIFVPLYGAIAAAWTTLVTEGAATLTAGWLVWKEIRFRVPVIVIISSLAIAAVSGGVALLLSDTWHILVRLCVLAVLYVAIAVFVRTLDPRSMSLLLQKKHII